MPFEIKEVNSKTQEKKDLQSRDLIRDLGDLFLSDEKRTLFP